MKQIKMNEFVLLKIINSANTDYAKESSYENVCFSPDRSGILLCSRFFYENTKDTADSGISSLYPVF
ncbi:hypothetical protein C4F50_07355 [Flavobacterium sp. KB82]|uniref:Uncharacterized protein n=1 Tax=Flavobacterium hungaricum TaxID=2082725 RepID=A0ABR9THC7_9FLAO|nr:hypothetical protein [Flavobacterium hungaricum]